MSREHFRTSLRAAMAECEELADYINFPPYTWVKETELVLRIVSFDPGKDGFDCVLSVLPLAVPNQKALLSLSYGVDLASECRLPFRRWAYGTNRQGTGRKVLAALRALVEAGLPWFDQHASERGILNATTVCDTWNRLEYAGYCALHLGQVEQGRVYLQAAIDYLGKLGFKWSEAKIDQYRQTLAQAADPRAIRRLLDDTITENRRALLGADRASSNGFSLEEMVDVEMDEDRLGEAESAVSNAF